MSEIYLKRKIDSYLASWKENPDRRSLIVRGPRQVGKSTLAGEIIPKDAKVLEINGDNTDIRTMFVNVDESKMKILIGNKNFSFRR